MSRRRRQAPDSGWSTVEKRRLLAGLESGAWSLAGACYRFGLSAADTGSAAPKACSILDPDCEACQ